MNAPAAFLAEADKIGRTVTSRDVRVGDFLYYRGLFRRVTDVRFVSGTGTESQALRDALDAVDIDWRSAHAKEHGA